MSSGYTPPPWQAPPRRGWGDPRVSQNQPPQQQQYGYSNQTTAQSPISPINPQAFAYHPPDSNQPVGYGSQPQYNATQYDTSAWGVKYNQSQNQQWQTQGERPPALPPRPSSTTNTADHQYRPSSAGQWQGYDNTQAQQSYHHQQPSWSTPQQNLYAQTAPPPPPPKPPPYEPTNQTYSQPNTQVDQYSHHPPTHHYDPQVSSSQYERYTPTPGPVYGSAHDAAPVSPIDSGPNKWPTSRPPASTSSAAQAPVQAMTQPSSSQFYSTALGPYGGPSDWEHFGNEGPGSPSDSTPLSAHARPETNNDLATSTSEPKKPVPVVEQSPPTESAKPTKVDRHGSDTPSNISQGVRRTDTIDGVINAWSEPLRLARKTGPASMDGSSRPQSRDSGRAEPAQGKVVEVIKEVIKVVDPYDDLQPEVRASLKRYAEMLRKEAAAETDEEKFAAFEAFIKKELRLRAMLYGMDSPLQLIKTQERPNPPAAATPSASLQPSIAPPPVPLPSPAVPSEASNAPPKTLDSVFQPPPERAPESPVIAKAESTMPNSAIPTESLKKASVPGPSMSGMASMLKDSPVRHSPSKDDSFVMVGADDTEQYSPGGRPRVTKPVEEAYSPGGRPIVANISKAAKHVPEISIPAVPQTRSNIMSPGANAPMVLEDYLMPGLPSPGANAPMLVEPPSPSPPSASANAPIPVEGSGNLSKRSSTASNLKFEPARPVYTPFRYNPTVQAPLMPADKSYSSLRKDGAESGRLLKHDSKSSVSATSAASGLTAPSLLPPPVKMQDEAFIGLIRQQSMAVRKTKKPSLDAAPPVPSLRPGTPATKPTVSPPSTSHGRMGTTPIAALRPGTPAAPQQAASQSTGLQGAVASLRALLPESVPDGYGQSINDQVNSIKSQLDAIPDQFAYIHQTVVDWDQRNRQVRKHLDEERNTRQAESEARIDDLFNDNEIGYADIGALEADFKLSEARLKYDEDKDELDSFTGDVYDSVTKRLQSELAQLNASYVTAVDLLDLESEPASQCLLHKQSSHGAAPPEMGLLMNLLLSAFNKIELRQQKIAEAKVERERRRKRLELTVLYTNGDTPGVKKLEAEFAVAEKMQVLHEARERDARANKLMDTFDRATVRGLGDNQTFVDGVLPRIRALRDVVMMKAEEDEGKEAQSDEVKSELLYGPQGVRETLQLTQRAVDLVLLDSQKLLTVSHVADGLLNDADYAVSVAEARAANAGKEVYDKLKEEKEKEDAKIVEDTGLRMAAVGKGPEEVGEVVREVVDKCLGDGEGHRERIGKALEEARRRNEGLAVGAEGPAG